MGLQWLVFLLVAVMSVTRVLEIPDKSDYKSTGPSDWDEIHYSVVLSQLKCMIPITQKMEEWDIFAKQFVYDFAF